MTMHPTVFPAQVRNETLQPAVAAVLDLYSAWYPGPGLTGTYDWYSPDLAMAPNPFILWNITGLPTAGARRRLLLAQSISSIAGKATACTHAGNGSSCRRAACAGKSGERSLLAAAAAAAMPVQGRVSVREARQHRQQQRRKPASTDSRQCTIDEDISALVPATPAIVPTETSTPTNAGFPGLPAAQQAIQPLSPVIIACIAAGVFIVATAGMLLVRRWQRRRAEQPMARQQTLQELLDSRPARPSHSSRTSVCTPRHVNPTAWSEGSFTEVHYLQDGETGWDSSFGGRPVLPPARDSLADD